MIFYTLMKYCYHEDTDQNDGTFCFQKNHDSNSEDKSSTLTNLENEIQCTSFGNIVRTIFLSQPKIIHFKFKLFKDFQNSRTYGIDYF